jgi:hypothetical protein
MLLLLLLLIDDFKEKDRERENEPALSIERRAFAIISINSARRHLERRAGGSGFLAHLVKISRGEIKSVSPKLECVRVCVLVFDPFLPAKGDSSLRFTTFSLFLLSFLLFLLLSFV